LNISSNQNHTGAGDGETWDYGYNFSDVFDPVPWQISNPEMMNNFFRRFFNPKDKLSQEPPAPEEGDEPVNGFQARLQRAAESILENEALTAELDDEAAQVLIDWGVSLAQRIASETIELDEAAAEEATYQPMRALRKMLRKINNWAGDPDDSGLEEILEQAAITYGAGYASPGTEILAQFGNQVHITTQNPAENIRQLRAFIDNQAQP
jgi:hypothetical protein